VNLEEFIKETLVQLSKGVENANTTLSSLGSNAIVNPQYYSSNNMEYDSNPNDRHFYRPKVSIVSYDVAISASEGQGSQGGIGIMIGAVGVGTRGECNSSESTESRIQFEIPIVLPTPRNVE
jgi:hypothetical protein